MKISKKTKKAIYEDARLMNISKKKLKEIEERAFKVISSFADQSELKKEERCKILVSTYCFLEYVDNLEE